MKAIQINGYDGIDGMNLAEIKDPTPGPGEVLLRMTVATVNPADWKVADGMVKDLMPLKFPYTPGCDGAGVVESGAMPAGERVAVCTDANTMGTFAEKCVVPAGMVAAIPDSVNDRAAAALSLVGLTAWSALHHAATIQPDERVLILGASGGVGQAAVQIAVAAGCHVVGVASGKTEQMVRNLGAEEFIDYKTDGLTKLAKVDVILDAAGTSNLSDAASRLNRGGRIYSVAQPVDEKLLAEHDATGSFYLGHPKPGDLATLLAMAADGKLTVSIDAEMPLSEVAVALRKSKDGKTTGKILLIP